MEDKTFELLTKMYRELTDFRSEVKSDIQKVSNQVVKLENDLKPKVELALEGYHDVREILTRVEGKLDDLAEKFEYHDIEIAALKSEK